MNFQIVIIFFVTVTAKIEQIFTNECGNTSSWQKGNTATIVFSPYSIFKSRTWIHSIGQLGQYQSPVGVYNSNDNGTRPTRYIEEFSDGRYMLKIHDVTTNDSGLYSVVCITDDLGFFFSDITDLQITREHKTTEVENKILYQPIEETTRKCDDNPINDNKVNHSAKDKTMIIDIVIGIAVGIVSTSAVVLVILLICKHRKTPNSVNITNTENHTVEAMTVASSRNESNNSNSRYVSLLPTSRSNNKREYADLMTSQPHRDYENQQRESARYINIS